MNSKPPLTEDASTSEASAETPIGKFKLRGSDTISTVGVAGIMFVCVLMWQHMKSSEEILKQLVAAQRLTACIMATPEDKREQQYMQPNSFCNRMAN